MPSDLIPSDYPAWLTDLKVRIQQAQQRATLSVNRELIALYWLLGKDILTRQAEQGWGAKVIERLSRDLRAAFPEMKGFSRANLLYMRAFAEAWPDPAIVQQAVGQLPWGHNIVLLTRLKAPEWRLTYARQAIEHGWSRNVLNIHIETQRLEREGKAVTNFDLRKDRMGLTTWKDAPKGKIQKFDVSVAKNYLTEDEMAQLQRLVSAYLDVAEDMALRQIPMTMQDWETRLNRFIAATDREILQDAGKVTAEIAQAHAESEFEKYRIVQDRLFESDFDQMIKQLPPEGEKP